jgi:aspartate racemase
MSWESSREYYRTINEAVAQRLGGAHSAKIILASVDFAEIEEMQRQGRWDDAGTMLLQAAQGLERAGAELLALCTNTMHIVAPTIEGGVSIPFLHIVDPTAVAVTARGIERVGLLGTRFTMEQDFYRGRLEREYGLEVLLPTEAERQIIHDVIYQELIHGVVTAASKERYLTVIAGLVERGAQGVILGCTEIMLLVQQADVSVPIFDTTELHAQAAVDLALPALDEPEELAQQPEPVALLLAHSNDLQRNNGNQASIGESAMATAQEVLDQIAAEVRVCTKCDLCKGTKNGVPGEGSASAEIMFIGEGPGFNEDRLGRPFVGQAGHLLDKMIAAIGMRREDVFIANVVKHRPPENRDPLPDEIAACADYLDRQIAALKPKVIVTLGRFSMARYFPGSKISAIHGQAKKFDQFIAVAMFHPAAALRAPAVMKQFEEDFQRAIPAALAEARRLAAEGKLSAPRSEKDEPDAGEPPQQLSLF